MDDLVEREGLFYKKFTDVPFTGEVRGQVMVTGPKGETDRKCPVRLLDCECRLVQK